MSIFSHSSLPTGLQNMVNELNQLGGGNADYSNANVDVFVAYDNKNGYSRTIKTLGPTVCVLDSTAASVNTSNFRYFNVSSSFDVEDLLKDTDNIGPARDVFEWSIQKDFNSCVVGYGLRECGKTAAVFGHSATDSSIFSSVIEQLFEYSEHCSARRKYEDYCEVSVGISVWCVRGNTVYDLCGGFELPPDAVTQAEFTLIDCPTKKILLDVFHECRVRAWKLDEDMLGKIISGYSYSEQGLSHLFVRVVVHKDSRKAVKMVSTGSPTGLNITYINFVDIIGEGNALKVKNKDVIDLTVPLNAQSVSLHNERERIAHRIVLLQQQSFKKVISELKSYAQKDELEAVLTTSARDSVLMKILAPIIQGNSKVWYLLFIKDSFQSVSLSKSILNLFQNVNQLLKNPCYRYADCQTHYNICDLKMKHFESVLSNQAMQTTKVESANHILPALSDSVASLEFLASTGYDFPEESHRGDNKLSTTYKQPSHTSSAMTRSNAYSSHYNDVSEYYYGLEAAVIDNDGVIPSHEVDINTDNITYADVNNALAGGELNNSQNFDTLMSQFHALMTSLSDAEPLESVEKRSTAQGEAILSSKPSVHNEYIAAKHNERENPSVDVNNVDVSIIEEPFEPNDNLDRNWHIAISDAIEQDSLSGHEGVVFVPRIDEVIEGSGLQHVPQIDQRSERLSLEDVEKFRLERDLNHDPAYEPANPNTSYSSHSAKEAWVESRDHGGDISVLSSTNDALLETIERLRKDKLFMQSQVEGLKADMKEQQLQYEVNLSDLKLQVTKYQTSMRQMDGGQSITAMYDSFQAEISRLRGENELLLKKLVDTESDNISCKVSSNSCNDCSECVCLRKQCGLLRKRLKENGIERIALKRQVEDAFKSQRQRDVAVHLAEDCQRRLRTSYHEGKKYRELLQAEQIAHTELIRLSACLKSECANLSDNETKLRQERSRTLAELAQLREHVREMEERYHVLNKVNRVLGTQGVAAIPSKKTDFALRGVAGSHNATYPRYEESYLSDVSLPVETALSNLHRALTMKCPILLPELKTLRDAVAQEQRVLLEKIRTEKLTATSANGRRPDEVKEKGKLNNSSAETPTISKLGLLGSRGDSSVRGYASGYRR